MTPHASRFLERALLVNLAVHGLAMLATALLLLPGLPGPGTATVMDRAQYVAGHPGLWRLGWLAWQLTAAADLLLGVALLATRWVPRLPAALTVLVTLAAVVPDQAGEWRWITDGVRIARDAVTSGDGAPYLAFEGQVLWQVGGLAGALYLLMALGWTWCFAAARTWSRALTGLSVLTWGALALACAGPLFPEAPLPLLLVAGATAGGFVLLFGWLILVSEQVLRRSRPDDHHGRYAPWRHPRPGTWGRLLETIANSRLVRAVGELLPPVAFASDITDVIYVNYLVSASELEVLVPPGLHLQRLGPEGRYGMFSFLTYRHGHFGPHRLGPLRRLLPSPVQSNWRIYVRDPVTGREGVYFVSTAIDRTLHALAARLLAEGMPMHLLAHGAVTADADGSFAVSLDPGKGSGPDAEIRARPTFDRSLSGPWAECFADYHAALAYCVPQDRALSSQPWYSRITRQEIQLGIALEVCQPLAAEIHSRAAAHLVGSAPPLCFRVPWVCFRFDEEYHDRRRA